MGIHRGGRVDRTITVGLLWHSVNSDNLGIGALTVSQIAIARAAAARAGVGVRFRVLGWKDPREAYVTGPDIEATGLRQRDLLRPRGGLGDLVRGTDAVLDIGAGDSFADIYGPRRALMQLVGKAVVLWAGRPLVLSPQTIGPFRRPWVRAGARAMLGRAEAVFTRDRLSTEYLGEIGHRAATLEASDVALRLPFDRPAPRSADGPVRVGLNVSGLLFNGGYDGANMFGLAEDYAATIRRLLGALTGPRGREAAGRAVEVHLVPHVISDGIAVEDDWRVCQRLAGEFPGTVLAPRFASPSEAKGYIAALDLFAGARMHACIAAFSAGVPVVPMAYSRKFAGLFGTLGYDATVDCRTSGAAEIEAAVLGALAGREALSARLRPALAEGLRRLDRYEDFLTDLFAGLAGVARVPEREAA